MGKRIWGMSRRSAAWLFGLSRRDKQILQVLADSGAVLVALFLSAMLNDLPLQAYLIAEFVLIAPLTVLVMMAMGCYRAVVRYMSFGLAPQVIFAVIVGTFGLALLQAVTRDVSHPRVLFDFGLFSLVLIALPRQVLRWVYELLESGKRELVVIYGAGAAGRQLAMALRGSSRYRIVGFVDEDPALAGARILDLPVQAASSLPEWVEAGARHILLALPNTSISRRRDIIASLEHLEAAVQTVPDMADLVSGRAKVGELRNVEIDDLLGRDPVTPDTDLIERDIRGKVVMVTGAGGSIGSEICRQIIRHQPMRLILFERSEFALYELERELRASGRFVHEEQLIPVLGSVCDVQRVRGVIDRFRVDTIFHAAAYKHVPLVECNALAAVDNNVRGTWQVAQAAVQSGVDSFVLISTDKAVRPTNVMGASKRLAELGVQALARLGGRTRLSIVRFGNVLGSSGSVVPLFQSQIEAGGPVTVTHPDIIRYFMTIPEAAQLVIQAGALGDRGDVFVLDMGEPVNIKSLAERMIRLAGFRPRTAKDPDGDIEIRLTGLRPGEKLYEELLISEQVHRTSHPRISRSDEPFLDMGEFSKLLAQLEDVHERGDVKALQRLLLSAPLHYQPNGSSASDLALEGERAKVIPGPFLPERAVVD